jgi:hypothetical protein
MADDPEKLNDFASEHTEKRKAGIESKQFFTTKAEPDNSDCRIEQSFERFYTCFISLSLNQHPEYNNFHQKER